MTMPIDPALEAAYGQTATMDPALEAAQEPTAAELEVQAMLDEQRLGPSGPMDPALEAARGNQPPEPPLPGLTRGTVVDHTV